MFSLVLRTSVRKGMINLDSMQILKGRTINCSTWFLQKRTRKRLFCGARILQYILCYNSEIREHREDTQFSLLDAFLKTSHPLGIIYIYLVLIQLRGLDQMISEVPFGLILKANHNRSEQDYHRKYKSPEKISGCFKEWK